MEDEHRSLHSFLSFLLSFFLLDTLPANHIMLTLENDIINRNKITNRTLRLWWLRVLLALGSICTCSSFRLLSSSMNHGGVQNLHHKHQYHKHPCESKRSVLEPMLAVRWNNYHCLFMSGEKEEESSFSLNDNDNDNDNKEAKILETLYSRTSLVFGFASALLFLIPDKTLTKRLATKWGGAAGFGLASYASRILQQQVQRTTSSTATSPTTSVSSGSSLLLLSNDTYKRWNLGLCGFCVLAIPSVPGEAWFWPSPAAAIGTSLILTATRIFGAMVFYRGWKFGFVSSSSVAAAAASVSTSSRVTQELWQGWKKNWKGIRVCTKPKASLFYRNSLLVVLFAMFSNLMEGIFHMRVRKL